MAKRLKKAESNILGVLVLGLAALAVSVLSAVPAWVWYAAIAGVLGWWGWKLYQKNAGVKVTGVAPASVKSNTAVWVPAGQYITFDGLHLPGGMLYVGKSLQTRSGTNDPALLNTSMVVAKKGDYTVDQMDYWPNYSAITPEARRSYLQWLAGGRKDPKAEIGFVFLFFYGLERRAVLDADGEGAGQDDWPAIALELRRLLGIYGPLSKSFRRYATALLTWVELGDQPSRLYERPVPEFSKSAELPMYLRFGLGQAALERKPVPAEFALAWALLEPSLRLPTLAQRLHKEFRELFLLKYREAYGTGMVLPVNRTKLCFTYVPASSGFRGFDDIRMGFGDVPDVSVLTAPVQQLQEVVDAVAEALAPYGRFVGKNPAAATAQEALLLLPAPLWPAAAQEPLRQLVARMKSGLLVKTFGEVLALFGLTPPGAKAAAHSAARALESFNIAMEPDILGGAKVPRTDDPVVLFATQPGEPCDRFAPEYQTAALTLQLGSSVAMADGEMDATELRHLRQHIEQWAGLTPAQQQRLRAHLRLLVATPFSLTTLSKKLEVLDAQARQTIAKWLSGISQVDGTVSAAEVGVLEKVYRALGLDQKAVYSNVHGALAAPAVAPITTPRVPAPSPVPVVPTSRAHVPASVPDEPVPVTRVASAGHPTAFPVPNRPPAAAPAGTRMSGLSFVFTGTLSDLRSRFISMVTAAGGSVATNVSRKTSYLVAGVRPGAALTRARELDVPVLDEVGLRTMLAQAAAAPAVSKDPAASVVAGQKTPASAQGEPASFQLDAARIAALQEDSARVSALLAKIFAEEPPPEPVAEPVDVEVESEAGLMGLDAAHTSFVRMLLSRPHWSREELKDVATDLDVMLDGALERVNEAAFDAYDEALTEGDDPVTVNHHILEKVEA